MQAPYPAQGVATGRALCMNGTPTGSIKKVFENLHNHGLIAGMPSNGNLKSWAQQGVCLLNVALTTPVGVPTGHEGTWSAFTDGIIKELAARNVIFILLGRFAQGKKPLIGNCWKFEGIHPSTTNPVNCRPGPLNFVHCTAFADVNKELEARKQTPINWNSVFEDKSFTADAKVRMAIEHSGEVTPMGPQDEKPPAGLEGIFIFTDGGALANGKPECVASWSFYATDGVNVLRDSGIVEPVEIPDQVYKASNNRGELTAILRAVEALLRAGNAMPSTAVTIVSDSKYSMDCVTQYITTWRKAGRTAQLNYALIDETATAVDKLKLYRHVIFRFQKGHNKVRPVDPVDGFYWWGNDVADRACSAELCEAKK